MCRSDDRRHVFFETAPAEAHATPEEAFADPVVEPDGVGHLVGVDAVLLADVPEVIDEADLRREEGVVRVLDYLRLAEPRFDDRCVRG